MFFIKRIVIALCWVALLTPSVTEAQVAPKKLNSAEIFDRIKKLQVLGSVLYVAAHPDDENTRMISYFANARHYDVTYLSLTRGDGGQNLIGTELSEYLGVLRTQELLMARSVDGGRQMFSRANDFGFSKSPAETFRIWGKNAILSDVVWVMRKLQPDVVINRFSIDTSFDTHGHHTGSAILSYEAFDIAGNPSVFPEQLKFGVQAWQPRRILHNISWWWFGNQQKFDEYVKKEQTIALDAGVFLPTKGKSNDEIAAESRSMHKCQAMGMLSSRGSNLEYLQYLKGAKGDVKATKDPFEGINTSWSRLEGGAPIGKLLALIEKNYRYDNPAASVPDLVKAYQMIQKLPESHWRNVKRLDISEVIKACLGLYLEASVNSNIVIANENIDVNFETINRSDIPVKFTRLKLNYLKNEKAGIAEKIDYALLRDTSFSIDLKNNIRQNIKMKFRIPLDIQFTNPYWLNNSSEVGLYNVNRQILRGLPETPRSLQAEFTVEIGGEVFNFKQDAVNVFAIPSKGEMYRPLEVTPPVYVNVGEKVYAFADNDPKDVNFVVKAGADKVNGILRPQIPKGWTITPEVQEFDLKLKGEEKILTYRLTPPANPVETTIVAKAYVRPNYAVTDNLKSDYVEVETKAVRVIEYDHVPTQTVLKPAEAKIVKLDLIRRGNEIGYFMGAGDDMPNCLQQIGYKVTLLSDNDLTSTEGLKRFDAIVLGIRAYNTKEKLKFYNQNLLEYVKNGGTLIVQYNTTGRDLLVPNFGPYPLKLGRGRTTEEDAEVRFLKPQHPALNTPNKITPKDFEGWVQERGLYFLSEWDSQYESILSSNDLNEKKEDGGLVIAKFGKGYYVYTGYSFFRQLPAGVSGAYRLFANLLSLGKVLP